MSADWIDRAFLVRARSHSAAAGGLQSHSAAADGPQPPSAPAPPPIVAGPAAPAPPPRDAVGMLLELVPEAWGELAAPVVAAVAQGRRVVAVTGGAAAAGRSTVVAGLAATLRAAGMTVATTTAAPLRLESDAARAARAADVVLVDAGPWFGEPLPRPGALARAALGCDAVILVGRDDAPPAAGWSRVLERLGLAVLAEVRTFVGAAAA